MAAAKSQRFQASFAACALRVREPCEINETRFVFTVCGEFNLRSKTLGIQRKVSLRLHFYGKKNRFEEQSCAKNFMWKQASVQVTLI